MNWVKSRGKAIIFGGLLLGGLCMFSCSKPEYPRIKHYLKLDFTESVALDDEYAPGTLREFKGNSTKPKRQEEIFIKIRGASTRNKPKKQWSLKIVNKEGQDKDIKLCGMGKESDWVLNGPYTDKTLIRNALAFEWFRKMGHNSTGFKPIELFVNGEYRGFYYIFEKIKRGKKRVNVRKLTNADTTGSDITGGYIFKVDGYDPEGTDGWLSIRPDIGGLDVQYQFTYPADSKIHPKQRAYLKALTDSIDVCFDSLDVQHCAEKYLEVGSLIDMFLLQELSANPDGYRGSLYLVKDHIEEGNKVRSGPPWDFNYAFGNVEYDSFYLPEGWIYNRHDETPLWMYTIITSKHYGEIMKQRWKDLRNGILSKREISKQIDALAWSIEPAARRNFMRWDIMGKRVSPNHYSGKTYEEEIELLKDWIFRRIEWMDNELMLTTKAKE